MRHKPCKRPRNRSWERSSGGGGGFLPFDACFPNRCRCKMFENGGGFRRQAFVRQPFKRLQHQPGCHSGVHKRRGNRVALPRRRERARNGCQRNGNGKRINLAVAVAVAVGGGGGGCSGGGGGGGGRESTEGGGWPTSYQSANIISK